jgi:hypothetical protein
MEIHSTLGIGVERELLDKQVTNGSFKGRGAQVEEDQDPSLGRISMAPG